MREIGEREKEDERRWELRYGNKWKRQESKRDRRRRIKN